MTAYSGHETFNMSMVVDRAAEESGDRVVLRHFESGKEVTCREVAHMTNRVGNALRLLGVEVENRVAILMDDRPEWVHAFFGALKIGAVPTPLNTLLTEKDYAFFLKDSRAKVLFVDASYMDKVEKTIPSLPYLKRVVLCSGNGDGLSGGPVVHWETFIDGVSGDLEVEPTSAGDVALFVYTSGSTGRPRAIMHPHGNYLNPSFNREGFYGIRDGAVQFHIPKLYFLTSLGGVIVAFHTSSSAVLLSGRPTPSTVLEVIARYRPNFLNGSPTIYARMVDHVKEAPHLADLSSVDYIFGTGEALSPEVFRRFRETFGKPIYNCWGAQELSCAPLSWRYGEAVPPEKVGSSGKSILPGIDVKIVDEDGREVENGVPGEIMLHVERPFLGYWHEPEGAPNRFFGGWYKPGDSFVRDEDGYYWYRGRLDDMVKVGGRQISPVEIEQAVARHPDVLEDAVVPIKNNLGLYEIHAFVVLKDGDKASPELAEGIQRFVKEELAPYKRPQYVRFLPELPRTATGKIQRYRLVEQTLDP